MKAASIALGAVLVALYPVAIWVGLTHFGARTVGILVLVVLIPSLAWRFRRASRDDLWVVLRVPALILFFLTLGIVTDDRRFVLALPVLVNAGLLLTFGLTLWRPPTMIERFARMQETARFRRENPEGPEPEEVLSSAQVRHCRQTTWVWCGFFLLNGAVAGLLVLWADAFWWAAYNGGMAYALMGLLFVGEYIVRQYRFRQYGSGLHDRLLSRLFPPAKEERS